MKTRPILFSAPMVRALLAGSKTQTRRVMKVQPPADNYKLARCMSTTGPKANEGRLHWIEIDGFSVVDGSQPYFDCPYGVVGDRLWVRETWQGPLMDAEVMENEYRDDVAKFHTPEYCQYAADGGAAPEFINMDGELKQCWKPSIFMPRWASRITLEITGVRVERLNDISEDDAEAEGIQRVPVGKLITFTVPGTSIEKLGARAAYERLWSSINGPGSWEANPWVWVVSFRRVV